MSCSAIFILDLKGNVILFFSFCKFSKTTADAILKYLEQYGRIMIFQIIIRIYNNM